MTLFLVTRPEPDCAATLAHLAALDLPATGTPLLEFAPIPASLPDPARFAAVAISSANALRALAESGGIAGYQHLPLFAVGDRTAAVATELGFTKVHSAGGGLPELARDLAGAAPAGPVFYPCAADRAGDLAALLRPGGIAVETVPVYRMRPIEALPALTTLQLVGGQVGAALFYSRRTAEVFAALTRTLLTDGQRENLAGLCISAKVGEVLIANRFPRVCLADERNEDAMMTLALAFARDQSAH